MDKHLINQLYIWTYDKIKKNPKRFGGDFSNSLIMCEYPKEFCSDFQVIELEPQVISILSTISRIKNKLLEQSPKFDYHTKHKQKSLKNVGES